MTDLRLEPLSAATIAAAHSLALRPGQEHYIAPVSYSIAEPLLDPSTSWPRVVVDGDKVVGYIMGNFDPEHPKEEFRSVLWRINVDGDAQQSGIGTFAAHALAEEARQRGFERLTVIWDGGDEGPERFFLSVGFRPIGETEYGEVLGALEL